VGTIGNGTVKGIFHYGNNETIMGIMVCNNKGISHYISQTINEYTFDTDSMQLFMVCIRRVKIVPL
jgi:hypothetical protein